MLEKLKVKILLNSVYHSQIDDQFERINQIFEIALRYLMFENSNVNWVAALLALQFAFNNAINSSIEKISNEICYEFKIQEVIFTIAESFMFTKSRFENLNIKTKKQLKHIETIKVRYCQEATNVCSYASLKLKIRYDSLHVSFLLKLKDKVFLRLHRDYSLFEKHNKKFFNQRCDSFLVKRRIDRLVYELDLSLRWKIHFVISITQLKLILKNDDFYKSC